MASKSSSLAAAAAWVSVTGPRHFQYFDIGFLQELAGRDVAPRAPANQPRQMIRGNACAGLAQTQIAGTDYRARRDGVTRRDALRKHRPDRRELGGHFV